MKEHVPELERLKKERGRGRGREWLRPVPPKPLNLSFKIIVWANG